MASLSAYPSNDEPIYRCRQKPKNEIFVIAPKQVVVRGERRQVLGGRAGIHTSYVLCQYGTTVWILPQ